MFLIPTNDLMKILTVFIRRIGLLFFLLFFGIVIFSLFYLIVFKDIFGFVMTIAVFLVLINRLKDRLFFLTMYVVVAVL
jgi:hypothetical protein